MPGLPLLTLTALLSSCGPLSLGLPQHTLAPAHVFWKQSSSQSNFLRELVRRKRHSASVLVRTQPHLVHDMGWPEIHETSRSRAAVEAVNSSQLNPRGLKEEEMERMVHLAETEISEDTGPRDSADSEVELLAGPADVSREASGFYGMDTEDRDRGEEGGEDDQDRRGGGMGGADEWDVREDREKREEKNMEDKIQGVQDSSVDRPRGVKVEPVSAFDPSTGPGSLFPAAEHDSRVQEFRAPPLLQVAPLAGGLWVTEKEDDQQSSGHEGLRLSSPSAHPTSSATSDLSNLFGRSVGTTTPETDTGTDFAIVGSYPKGVTDDVNIEREKEERSLANMGVFTQNPTAPEVGMAPSREPLQPSVEEGEQLENSQHGPRGFVPKHRGEEEDETHVKLGKEKTRFRHIVPLITITPSTVNFTAARPISKVDGPQQVVCLNWNELTGQGYVLLNLTRNINCEEFRGHQGVRLLKMIERAFSRRMNSPEGSWVLYLSKPTHQQHQLLMNLESGHGVIETQDALDMLGQIRKSLTKIGIESYGAASPCQSRPSKTRSDYGKLFVVLVIIGSVCMVIITSGVIYICWQRRLPAAKTMFRAEELRHVENSYHDNPTLDVTNDRDAEMQEKKPSVNGLAGGTSDGGGEDSSRWQVFVNQAVTEEEEDEQDTHL